MSVQHSLTGASPSVSPLPTGSQRSLNAIWTRRKWLGTAGILLAPFHKGLHAAEDNAYAEKVLKNGPVGYWHLNETRGGKVADSSGHHYDGVFHGNAQPGAPAGTDADSNRGLQFDGKKTHVEIPDHPDFSLPSSGAGLTVEVWMCPEVLDFPGQTEDPYVMWLGKGGEGQYEWGFRFYSRQSSRPNRISAYAFNPKGGLGAGAYFEDKLAPGQWIHVVAHFASGSAKNPRAGVSIYKNGKFRLGPSQQGASGTLYRSYDVTPSHGSSPLRFGSMNLKSFFTGKLADVAIYPRALSAAEIMNHYRTGSSIRRL